jgi:predicted lipid-binding transport protein (Tim44 family)
MSGLAGGLLGAGLAGMLLGHGFGGMAGMLGFLLQIALVGGLIWLVVRLFRGAPRPASAMAGGPAMGGAMARDAMGGQPQGYGGAGGAPSPMRPIDIAASDYQEFERLLIAIQAGWSNRDPNALRGITTPEMFRYFGEQIQESQARGLHNKVTEVRLLSGDLSEAWAEGEREYATVAMKFGLIDATYDAQGRVVEGDPTRPTTATEESTFLRVRGGPWALSAIQQIN